MNNDQRTQKQMESDSSTTAENSTEELLQKKREYSTLPTQFQPPPGLPEPLKSRIEALSGVSMDDVRVYYNSPKPSEVQALAYAQQTEIYLAPGQEQYLAHEAWHIVQQKQGRVKPLLQTRGIAINDDEDLEREADLMGNKAISFSSDTLQIQEMVLPETLDSRQTKEETTDTTLAVIQRIFDAFLREKTVEQVLMLVEEKYTFDSTNREQIIAAIGGYHKDTARTYNTIADIASALRDSKLIGKDKGISTETSPFVKLYHTTSIDNLEGIASSGLLVSRSGSGGFTSQASSISGDTSTEAKRVATSTGKIHLANLAMALSYFEPFKMRPEVDKILDPLLQTKFNEMQQQNPTLKRYQFYGERAKYEAEILAQNPIIKAKVDKINGPKAILVIHEPFTEAEFYDRDPDESDADNFRAVRKNKDIPATSIFILTSTGDVPLQTYVKNASDYICLDNKTATMNKEEEAQLEAFIAKIPAGK